MSTQLPPGEPVYDVSQEVVVQPGKTEEFSSDEDRPACVLWLPDPEQRHGWREYYVKKTTPKPNSAPMGYRKRS